MMMKRYNTRDARRILQQRTEVDLSDFSREEIREMWDFVQNRTRELLAQYGVKVA